MFLLIGISGKIKDCGRLEGCVCPVCGGADALHLCNKYMTPHIFFIPTFRFNNSYIATCHICASVMELEPQKGRMAAKGMDVQIDPQDLHVLQNNCAHRCAGCGARMRPDSLYCDKCGVRRE